MSKVTMPEPVILRTVMPDDHRYGHVYGFTRKQMAAYAASKVREALEEAAGIVTANAESCSSDARIMLRANAAAILALIPDAPRPKRL